MSAELAMTAPGVADAPPVVGAPGVPAQPARRRSGDGGGGDGAPGGRGGDGRGGHEPPFGRLAVLGVWIALAPILMLFLAFVSAYVVRQGLGQSWSAVPVPPLLWINTAVLVGSSVVLERGRRVLAAGADHAVLEPARENGRVWLVAALALGLAFVLGQVVIWRQFLAQGIGMATSAYAGFFYLLTGTHAVHLAGGILALGAAALWPASGFRNLSRPVAVRAAAIYWHFMGALWVGLVLLLAFWQ